MLPTIIFGLALLVTWMLLVHNTSNIVNKRAINKYFNLVILLLTILLWSVLFYLLNTTNTHQELDKDGIIRTYSNTKDTSLVHTYETDDTHYYKGEVLYPDYAHDDTLMVNNADSLNWCIEHYDIASDGDINDVLHAYCIYNQKQINNILNRLTPKRK